MCAVCQDSLDSFVPSQAAGRGEPQVCDDASNSDVAAREHDCEKVFEQSL